MPLDLPKFTGPGSTKPRRDFFDKLCLWLASCQKKEGKNVSVDVRDGYGSVININPQRGGGSGSLGACCTDGSCTIETESDCIAGGGHFLGAGSTCDGRDCTKGACCDDDGNCTQTTEDGCSGSFRGYGTPCTPNPCPQPGACCVGEDCSIQTPANCTGLGGVFIGGACDPNPCAGIGACCKDGGCSILTSVECAAIGGTYQGDNTECTPNRCGTNCCATLHPTGCEIPPGGCQYATVTRRFSGTYNEVFADGTTVTTTFSGTRILIFTTGCSEATCYVIGSARTDYTFPTDPPQSCVATFVSCGYSPSRWLQQVAQCAYDDSGCGLFGINDGGLDFGSSDTCDGPTGTQTWNASTDDGHGHTQTWTATATDTLT